jgi:hypothetical protein
VKRFAIITIALLSLASCGKKKEDAPATPPPPAAGSGSAGSAAPTPTAAGSGSAAGSAAAPVAAAVDVPTEEDFEQQATTAIDDKNVEAKVQAIEKDLAQ